MCMLVAYSYTLQKLSSNNCNVLVEIITPLLLTFQEQSVQNYVKLNRKTRASIFTNTERDKYYKTKYFLCRKIINLQTVLNNNDKFGMSIWIL